MIIEFLAPITLSGEDKEKIRTVTNQTRSAMLAKIEQLNIETGCELTLPVDKKSKNT